MSNIQTAPASTVTLSLSDLEALIRRAVREEVRDVLAERLEEGPTIIEPGSALHQDLVELLEMKRAGTLELLSHKEVWGADDDLST